MILVTPYGIIELKSSLVQLRKKKFAHSIGKMSQIHCSLLYHQSIQGRGTWTDLQLASFTPGYLPSPQNGLPQDCSNYSALAFGGYCSLRLNHQYPKFISRSQIYCKNSQRKNYLYLIKAQRFEISIISQIYPDKTPSQTNDHTIIPWH